MIKQLTVILLLTYYLLGTFCLPRGDFSAIMDLPEMYRHCKANEDKDMTPLDFITDHLVNVDGLFDKHNNGDEQKPHSPVQCHCMHDQVTFLIQSFRVLFTVPVLFKNIIPISKGCFYSSDYIAFVFRPPVV